IRPHPELGELRVGFAQVGVPHLVILRQEVTTADVVGRGRPLRHHPSLAAGANVGFVAPQGPQTAGSDRQALGRAPWIMRTYERGVEAETLACGSGAVATAILLTVWGLSSGPVQLETSSGRLLTVRLRHEGEAWMTVPRRL